MAHYITVPVNANGVIFDSSMDKVLADAMAEVPFGFRDVYVYSHGWSTNADQALDEYAQFSIELARSILISRLQIPDEFAAPPQDDLGIGIHWPSAITEDPNSPLNDLELITFYTMEQRADAVGKNAVYVMLRIMFAERVATGSPLRVMMIGHSFGCKVVLAALQQLKSDMDDATVVAPAGTEFNVVLLQPATDNDNLESGDIYGKVSQIDGLRLLLTISSKDIALGTWFPLAGKLANLFHPDPKALGFAGPTAVTSAPQAFGPAAHLAVNEGFVASSLSGVANRLIVADLSPVHEYRIANGMWQGGFSGSHSDISFEEIYQLICGFFFKAQVSGALAGRRP